MSFEYSSDFLHFSSVTEMSDDPKATFRFKSFVLNVSEHRLTRDGQPISLTPKAFAVLVYLVERSGHLVEKGELMDSIWGDSFVEEGNLSRTIHDLRRALGQDRNGNKFIETVPTKGYRFVVPSIADDETNSLNSYDLQTTVPLASRASGTAIPATANEVTEPSDHYTDTRNLHFNGKLALLLAFGLICILAITGAYFYSSDAATEGPRPSSASGAPKLYWEMTGAEKTAFVRERTEHVQRLIGDDIAEINDNSLNAIQGEIDWYVDRRDSLSQDPFHEGLRFIYGRASQYVPLVSAQFEKRDVPSAVGIYQAMIESEYRDCLINQLGNTGLFQFTHRTARKYDLNPEDMCKVDRQSDAAARYMSDLLSDFGTTKSSWTLALLSFNQGEEQSRDQLRELRASGITERTYWSIFQNPDALKSPLNDSSKVYVPRFFAAAIIGETPESFDLATPALSNIERLHQ